MTTRARSDAGGRLWSEQEVSVKIQTRRQDPVRLLPLPMNEYLQQALAECYFDVQLGCDRVEYAVHEFGARRQGSFANAANATT